LRLPLLIAPLAALVVLAGCGSKKSTPPTTTAPPPTATGVSHAAPDLEAMLPARFDGDRLAKGSTTGAVVFGGDAFSRGLRKFLAARCRSPADLRFANAQSAALGLETGVFQVNGIPGTALARGIVAASRPNAPGLTAQPGTLDGKAVTRVVYPGGQVLYLYPHGNLVFYVGTQSEAQARNVIALLP
jgi:hypothetical protein